MIGVLGFLFKGGSSGETAEFSSTKERCEACEEEFVPGEFYEDGLCSGCAELSGGPKYCCGVIYESGEDVCASCGEGL